MARTHVTTNVYTFHQCIASLIVYLATNNLLALAKMSWMGMWFGAPFRMKCLAQHSGKEHYDDVIMTMLESQITNLTVVYSIVYSGVHQKKHQSSASLAFVREIHRGPVNFPHKWPVTRKMFPFDDVIMIHQILNLGGLQHWNYRALWW